MTGIRALCNPRANALRHSNFLRLLDDPQHAPRLRFRELPRRLDLDQVAGLAFVALVVRVILVRLDDDLAVDRMLRAPLDEHGHRLVHLVADDASGDRLDQRLARRNGVLRYVLVRCLRVHPIAPCLSLPGTTFAAAAFCASSVLTRAMPRRTSFSFDVLVSCCVARCMRRPNCSFNSASSSVCSSAALLPASAVFVSVRFIAFSVNRRRGGARTSCAAAAWPRQARTLLARAPPRRRPFRRAPCPAGSRKRSTPGCPCRCPSALRRASSRPACPERCGSRCGRRA